MEHRHPTQVRRGARGSGVRLADAARLAAITLTFTSNLLLSGPAVVAGDWPQWRGPARDGHAAPDESLPSTLPAGREPLWRRNVGPGFASPVVVGDRLFHLDEEAGREVAHALDARTGEPVWKNPFAPSGGDEWGSGPRCTPVADDGRLYVQSLQGEFACLDQSDGRRLWGFSFTRDYEVAFLGGNDQADAAARRRGNTGAPVIVGDRIAVSVGSTNGATIVCFDKRSGSELWRAGHDEAAYAALMTARIAGRTEVVAYTAFALLGLDADRGTELWRIPLKTHANRHAVTPILDGDTLVVSSHTIGTRAFRVAAHPDQESRQTAAERWAQPQLKTSLATMVLVDGHLYGQGPDRDFVCLDAATGTTRWTRRGFGEKPLTGYSATIASGDRLLVLSESGQLVLIEADPAAYRELGRDQVCGKTWSHPAYAGGTLYLRDQRQLLALRLASKTAP
ncbi:MAG: PQQ-binding-like beta-propeller repeat protein [Limisphaerales bacterium]